MNKYFHIVAITVCENRDSFNIKTNVMKDNNIDSLYGQDSIDIHSEVFDKDFDDVGYEPVEEDDSDADAAELYDY